MQCSVVVEDRKHAKSCTANELNYVLQTTATHLEKLTRIDFNCVYVKFTCTFVSHV